MIHPPASGLTSRHGKVLRRRAIKIGVVFLTSWILSFQAGAVLVYFAGGQSNARPAWRDAAIAAIRVHEPTAQIVWNAHPGMALNRWFDSSLDENERQQYYLLDIYNPDTNVNGKLEQALIDLQRDGNNPILAGFLWFQGEADSSNGNYASEFSAFRDLIAADLRVPALPTSLAMVYDSRWSDPITIREQQFILDLEEDIVIFDTKSFARFDGVHLSDVDGAIVGTAMGNNLVTLVAVPEAKNLAEVAFLLFGTTYGLRKFRVGSRSFDGAPDWLKRATRKSKA